MAGWRRVVVCSLVALLLPILHHAPAYAAAVLERVVAIADGNTLTVLTEERQQVKVWLSDIDTPESAQPYGTRARQERSDLAFGRNARVEVRETDRYRRTVGRVHVGDMDVNAEMVRRGAAWVYRRYSHDPGLLAVEREAQSARRGL